MFICSCFSAKVTFEPEKRLYLQHYFYQSKDVIKGNAINWTFPSLHGIKVLKYTLTVIIPL